MSYHNTYSSQQQSTTNTQGQAAPPGYHYMPDGSLMLDSEHEALYGKTTINSFDVSTSNLKMNGEARTFTIIGDSGSIFSLEIKNELNEYYNFYTNLFQTKYTKLNSVSITGTAYSVNVLFPAVEDADQYDIYLFAENSTRHSQYKEVRFADNSIDINSTSGSNSNLLQKVIYQTLDTTITIGASSVTGVVTGSFATQALTVASNSVVDFTPFSIACTATSTKTFTVESTPTGEDCFATTTLTVVADPINIDGEDIYPTVAETDVVDGGFGEGASKIVMDNNVASKMTVGDRITTATTTDTVDGDKLLEIDFSNTTLKVVMDTNVATKMAVGDRVTGGKTKETQSFFNSNLCIVSALNPDGDNAKEFTLTVPNTATGQLIIKDGATLTFSSQLNRDVVTVAALNPDTDNVKEFSMTSNGATATIGIRDNSTLSFSPQRNHRWAVNNIHGLTEGMPIKGSTHFVNGLPTIKEYLVQTTVLENEPGEYKIDNVRVPALQGVGTSTTPSTPVTTRNATSNIETTVQTGNVVFSDQALLSLGGGANAVMLAYGQDKVKNLTGYDVEFNDLAVTLTAVSTTTTSVVNASTSVPITQRAGIADGISVVSGIGISSAVANPSVASGAGAVTGAGTVVLSAAQTLEDGITLTFDGASTIATITGNIKVNKVGSGNLLLNFDLDRFIAMQ